MSNSAMDDARPRQSASLARRDLKNKIKATADLPYNWDDSKGHAPDKRDIDNAVKFLEKALPPVAIPFADTSVSGEGEVGFQWNTNGHRLDIGFFEGRIYFYARPPNNKRIYGGLDFTTSLPPQLAEFMDNMFS